MNSTRLHVTNGDIVAATLDQSGLIQPAPKGLADDRSPDTAIAWRDMLSDGPVRGTLSPINLAHERCQYIAERGWQPYMFARQDMAKRDATIAQTSRFTEVTYWFEHDLSDQLQLLQALDRIAARHPEQTTFSWVMLDTFPGVESFTGLGQLTPENLATAYDARTPVPDAAWSQARVLWRAFASDTPAQIEELIASGTDALPFAGPALRRLLAEYPAVDSGLSQTERGILDAIATGTQRPPEIFAALQRAEPAPFLGDLQVWRWLDYLATGPEPLVTVKDGEPWVSPVVDLSSVTDPDLDAFVEQELTLSPAGSDVLAGKRDWLTIRSADRWIGGVHLQGQTPSWRWDTKGSRLVASIG